MKIDSIKGVFNKITREKPMRILGWGCLGITAVGMTAGIDYLAKDAASELDAAKTYVRLNDPNKYKKMESAGTHYADWTKEAEKIKDSLFIDSIAKTNYAKGMQAVRDSIEISTLEID